MPDGSNMCSPAHFGPLGSAVWNFQGWGWSSKTAGSLRLAIHRLRSTAGRPGYLRDPLGMKRDRNQDTLQPSHRWVITFCKWMGTRCQICSSSRRKSGAAVVGVVSHRRTSLDHWASKMFQDATGVSWYIQFESQQTSGESWCAVVNKSQPGERWTHIRHCGQECTGPHWMFVMWWTQVENRQLSSVQNLQNHTMKDASSDMPSRKPKPQSLKLWEELSHGKAPRKWLSSTLMPREWQHRPRKLCERSPERERQVELKAD